MKLSIIEINLVCVDICNEKGFKNKNKWYVIWKQQQILSKNCPTQDTGTINQTAIF